MYKILMVYYSIKYKREIGALSGVSTFLFVTYLNSVIFIVIPSEREFSFCYDGGISNGISVFSLGYINTVVMNAFITAFYRRGLP